MPFAMCSTAVSNAEMAEGFGIKLPPGGTLEYIPLINVYEVLTGKHHFQLMNIKLMERPDSFPTMEAAIKFAEDAIREAMYGRDERVGAMLMARKGWAKTPRWVGRDTYSPDKDWTGETITDMFCGSN